MLPLRHYVISYKSCRNRHCPKCEGKARHRWLEARQRELLPTPYVPCRFTLPRELARLALQNKKVVYDLLFRASAETLLEIARDPRHYIDDSADLKGERAVVAIAAFGQTRPQVDKS